VKKKVKMNITVGINTYMALKRSNGFNVSNFCDEALRKALDVKDIDLSLEESDIDDVIVQKQSELVLLEERKKELVSEREKEVARWKLVKKI
jgi:hypothetical protein